VAILAMVSTSLVASLVWLWSKGSRIIESVVMAMMVMMAVAEVMVAEVAVE